MFNFCHRIDLSLRSSLLFHHLFISILVLGYTMENQSHMTNQQYVSIYHDLGKSMRNLSLTSLIVAGIGIIGGLILSVSVVPIFLMMNSPSDADEISPSIITFAIVVGVAIIAVILFVLYRYIQYISNLKRAGDVTGDINLQKSSKMESGALITLILTLIITVVFFIPITNLSFSNPLEFYGRLLLPAIGIITIYGLLATSGFYLDRWAVQLRNSDRNVVTNHFAQEISDMKDARYAIIFTAGVAAFFSLVALMKAGNNLMKYPSLENQELNSPPMRRSNYSQNEATSSQLSYHQTTPTTFGQLSNTDPSSNFCPLCGEKIPNPNTSFCQNCGNKL